MQVISFVGALLLLAQAIAAQAQAAIDRGDPKTAIKLLEKAVAEIPNDADAHYLLGVAYGRRAEQPDAIPHAYYARLTVNEFEKAVAVNPDHRDARMALVQYYTLAPEPMGGSIQRAQNEANELLKTSPADGHRANAFIDAHLKKYDDAAGELREAVKLEPDDMPTWFEIGHLAAQSGKNLDEGERALEKYIAYTPKKGEPPREDALADLEKIRQRRGR